MFRLTRPLFNAAVRKTTTGIVGLAVHPNPLPELTETYKSTLSALSAIPKTSVYRQGVEALTQHKLKIVEGVNGDIGAAEQQLDEGQIEQSIDIAKDELGLVSKMIEWKAYVFFAFSPLHFSAMYRWEPLEEKPEDGQWEYPGRTATAETAS